MLGIVQTVLISLSALYLSLVFLIFMLKKRLANPESKIYMYLIIGNVVSIIVEFSLFLIAKEIFNKPPWAVYNVPILEGVNPAKVFFFLMVSKVFISIILFWFVNVFKYTFYLCYKSKIATKKFQRINTLISALYIIVTGIIMLLPLDYIITNSYGYVEGMATKFAMMWIMLLLVLIAIHIIIFFKKLEIKKIIPLILLVIFMVIGIVIQVLYPELLVFNPIISFITIFMYHTIENPDLKIINELYRNKELVEQNYEDKYNFFFEITSEARKPLTDITKLCNELKDEKDGHIVNQGLMLINNMVSQLNFTINNILDISMMDAHKLKLIDTKYNLEKFCNDTIAQIKANLSSDVELKVTLPNNMPTLYGDYLKLKQILYSLIINPARDKKNKKIEFKVDLIERFDCCRVIFTITTDESNISLEDINNILSATGEFSQNDLYNLEKKELDMVLCQKVVKIMGGNLMIKSNKVGTEIRLVIDQKNYLDEEETILTKYLNGSNDRRKVLVISQDKKVIEDMKKYFKKVDISMAHFLYGKDAIDRLKSGQKYNYIFVADTMEKLNGIETLRELKKIDKLSAPIIVMVNEGNENMGKHYLDEGFDDYLITNNITSELDKILKI